MAIRFLLTHYCTWMPCSFKRLSQEGGGGGRRAKFAENIRAFSFDKLNYFRLDPFRWTAPLSCKTWSYRSVVWWISKFLSVDCAHNFLFLRCIMHAVQYSEIYFLTYRIDFDVTYYKRQRISGYIVTSTFATTASGGLLNFRSLFGKDDIWKHLLCCAYRQSATWAVGSGVCLRDPDPCSRKGRSEHGLLPPVARHL